MNKSPAGSSSIIARNEINYQKSTKNLFNANQFENKFLSKHKVNSATHSARGEQRNEQSSENDVDRMNDQISEGALQLQERMKQISVYDLYQITNSQGSIPIDTFIKQQLLNRNANKEKSPIPGVAPQVKIPSVTSSQKSLSNVNINIGSVVQKSYPIEEQKVGSALFRHGQQPSTIPESFDENSLIGTPVNTS